jgi:hypothetical protein
MIFCCHYLSLNPQCLNAAEIVKESDTQCKVFRLVADAQGPSQIYVLASVEDVA